MIRASFSVSILLALGCSSGCGGAPPTVPEPPKAMDCQVIDASTLSGTPTQGAKKRPGLGTLLPGRGPGVGLPMTVPQLLSMRGVPSDAQWRALPPTADAVLVGIVRDTAAGEAQRARAMTGLAVRKAEGGPTAMAAVLADANTPGLVRRSAARALAAGWISDTETAGVAPLVAALADADALLREACAKALAPHAGRADVKKALADRLKVEDNDLVKEALTAALAE